MNDQFTTISDICAVCASMSASFLTWFSGPTFSHASLRPAPHASGQADVRGGPQGVGLSQMPPLPARGWGHMAALQQGARISITSHLDLFKQNHRNFSKVDLMLLYVRGLPADKDLSQLLMAELVYLHFDGVECPLIYDSDLEVWQAFEGPWSTSKGKNTRVKAILQKELLPAAKECVRRAKIGNHFPPSAAGDEHPRLSFLLKFASSLTNSKSVANLLVEAAMF